MGTRIFFASDVHGSEKCFRKFVNASTFYKADVLILGGDLTGKVLIPILNRGDGSYSLSLFGKDVVVGELSLEEQKKMLRDAGQYYFMAEGKEMEEIKTDSRRVDGIFLRCMLDVLKGWIALADLRLRGTGVKCYISPGNDDRHEIDEALTETDSVLNPENKVVTLPGGHEMITLGFANPTPWKSPREVPEEKLQEMIEALATQIREPAKSIFNLHVPPYGTEIDRAPAVDEEFRYVKTGLGTIKMISAGSTSVRGAIEKYRPLLGVHGHIHESKGFAKIGPTLCLNPGSEYGQGILKGALVNLEDSKVKEFLLTSG